MRAYEFITEVTIDVPDMMVTVQVPLSALGCSPETTDTNDDTPVSRTRPKTIEQPGLRRGKNGKTKWSPPLQQHLDTMKDSVQTDGTASVIGQRPSVI